MQISGLGFQPYIYNTNAISQRSMNKISAIGNDLTSQKTDFNGLANSSATENINPLKPGESQNFMDILSSQMAMSGLNAARVMQAAPEEIPVQNEIANKSQAVVNSIQNNPYAAGLQQSMFEMTV